MSSGASRVEVSAEFFPLDVECEPGYDAEVGLLFLASVTTFENGNQLFGFSDQGWMCVNMNNGHYYGHVDGVFGGGTGKFVGATGDWIPLYSGNHKRQRHIPVNRMKNSVNLVKSKAPPPRGALFYLCTFS